MLPGEVRAQVARLRERGGAAGRRAGRARGRRRVRARVAQQVGAHAEGARAARLRAGVRARVRVARRVPPQLRAPAEGAPALGAAPGARPAVRLRVDVQAGLAAEALVAARALQPALGRVQARVLAQRAARAERGAAHAARVRALAPVRVLQVVEVAGRGPVPLAAVRAGALAAAAALARDGRRPRVRRVLDRREHGLGQRAEVALRVAVVRELVAGAARRDRRLRQRRGDGGRRGGGRRRRVRHRREHYHRVRGRRNEVDHGSGKGGRFRPLRSIIFGGGGGWGGGGRLGRGLRAQRGVVVRGVRAHVRQQHAAVQVAVALGAVEHERGVAPLQVRAVLRARHPRRAVRAAPPATARAAAGRPEDCGIRTPRPAVPRRAARPGGTVRTSNFAGAPLLCLMRICGGVKLAYLLSS